MPTQKYSFQATYHLHNNEGILGKRVFYKLFICSRLLTNITFFLSSYVVNFFLIVFSPLIPLEVVSCILVSTLNICSLCRISFSNMAIGIVSDTLLKSPISIYFWKKNYKRYWNINVTHLQRPPHILRLVEVIWRLLVAVIILEGQINNECCF